MKSNSQLTIELGIEISRRRKLLNLSQEELAFSAGLHRTYISLVERGRKSPTIVTLESISKSLGISISDLIKSAEKTDYTSGKN